MDYTTITTLIMMVLTFVSFLFLYGMFAINIDDHTDVYRLITSISAIGIVLTLDTFIQTKLNFMIAILIITGILVVSQYIQNRWLLVTFYSFTIFGLIFSQGFSENPLLNGWFGLILIGVPALISRQLREWKIKNKHFIFLMTTEIVSSLVISVKVYTIYYMLDSLLYGVFLLILLGSQCLVICFFERDYKHLDHYYHLAFFDLESNTFSNNYLIEQIEQLDERDEDYQLMFVDIVIPRSEATKATINKIIKPLVATIREVVSEETIIGRLNFVRFCIILKADGQDHHMMIHHLKTRIKQLEHEQVTFVVNVIEKELGFLHVIDKRKVEES